MIKEEGEAEAEGETPMETDKKPEEKAPKMEEKDEWDDCDLEDEDMASDDEKEDKSESFEIVDKESSPSKGYVVVNQPGATESDASIVDSTISGKPKFVERKGTGVTRDEAFVHLDIKKAKFNSYGEILLGNGKILGHRQFAYIYKQKPRLPDTRECVVINKIALEYRKLRMIANGGHMDSLVLDPKFERDTARMARHINKRELHYKLHNNF